MIPHGNNLRELQLMADLGMSPTAVIESTTRIASELMGVDLTLGTIEVGKIVDLVAFTGTDVDVTDLKPRVARTRPLDSGPYRVPDTPARHASCRRTAAQVHEPGLPKSGGPVQGPFIPVRSARCVHLLSCVDRSQMT